ncbi:MAG: hypothetical protein FJZ16_06225 [Candidatus Omnitrophica bacterium]|nr:hypothetical protein [Candidatus Omnitrophota bacterium]
MFYYVPTEATIVNNNQTKYIKFDKYFLEKLFFISNTSLIIVLIGMPIKILEAIKICLEKFKYLSCELWLEVNEDINSKGTRAILQLLNFFEKEADWYQSYNRLSIVPLIRLKNSSRTSIGRFIALKDLFKERKLLCFPLLSYRVPKDIKFFNLILSNPYIKDNTFLIYSEQIDSNLLRLISTHSNVFTMHDGLNRCIQKKTAVASNSDCNIASKKLLVHSGGEIYSCYGGFLAKHPIGNISEKPLEEILNSCWLPAPIKRCDRCQRIQYCQQCRFMPEIACKLFCNSKPR